MPRKPKPKNTLTAGERAALYEAEQAEKHARSEPKADNSSPGGNTEKAENAVDAAKIELKKPQFATVKVDLSLVTGEIKPMHGMCNGPKSYGADISHLFGDIGIPYVRFDKTDGAISAYAVDISRIFKDISADPRNEANYDFSYTDTYVSAAYNAGANVIFRLGESHDGLNAVKKTRTPHDIDSFVDICTNVVRHYNAHWADGYAYGIQYFEIWGHPNGIYNASERDFELYRRVASAVKLTGEDIRVGGMCFSDISAVREFLKYCKKTRAPLDFMTVSCFDSEPLSAAERLSEIASLLKILGFYDTEIIIGEWSYIDRSALGGMTLGKVLSESSLIASEARRKLFDSQRSVKGAAYALAFMISLSKLHEVQIACFYDAQPNISPWCAVSDRFGNPEKPFYAFKAYGELFRAGRELYSASDEPEGFAHSGIYAMAARGKGSDYILISSFDGCGIVDLRLDSIPPDKYTADIYMLDGVKNMSLADSLPIQGDKKRLILNISTYGAALVRIY